VRHSVPRELGLSVIAGLWVEVKTVTLSGFLKEGEEGGKAFGGGD
jgi:hypothetical protein